MKTQVEYVVKGNTDTTEGRGSMVEQDVFADPELAIERVRSGRYGVMGHRGDGEVHFTILSYAKDRFNTLTRGGVNARLLETETNWKETDVEVE